jgi:hypothetical protein
VKWVLRVLKILVVVFVLLYAGDYLSLRYQFPHHRETLGTVEVNVYYAVKLKGKKTEFMRADSQEETCTYSLLPQMGYLPCWYVTSHKTKWVNIGEVLQRDLLPTHVAVLASSLPYSSIKSSRGCERINGV